MPASEARHWLHTYRRHGERVLRPLPRMQEPAGARAVPIEPDLASTRDCA